MTAPTHLTWSKHVKPDRFLFEDADTKSGREHTIPRTALVNQVLEDAKCFARHSTDLVFPSSKKDGAKISDHSQIIKKLIEIADVLRFSAHDLRRSVGTIMRKRASVWRSGSSPTGSHTRSWVLG